MIDSLLIAVGTYDGVLAGWEIEKGKLKIKFASPVHGGSVRALGLALSAEAEPSLLLSAGYDEVLRTHNLAKKLTSSGEVRTPSDLSTPVCCAFAPPLASTHCMVGFRSGKLVLYKKRDWSVVHTLNGHEGGVESLAVHPSGKLALSGGSTDGKVKLWDLTKGRLASVEKIPPASTSVQGRTHYDPVVDIIWSCLEEDDLPDAYALAFGSHVTVSNVADGSKLLDVELPSKVNQICFLRHEAGLFIAAACNDGSLPLLAVSIVGDPAKGEERRGMMAIEPVDGPVAGEERFKCIAPVDTSHVVTANSAGVVSLMNLQGAIDMICKCDPEEEEKDEEPVHPDSDDDAIGGDEEEELAVDIIDSIRLGTGARITCLAVWAKAAVDGGEQGDEEEKEQENEEAPTVTEKKECESPPGKRKRDQVTLDDKALAKARELVSEAKKLQQRKKKKRQKKK